MLEEGKDRLVRFGRHCGGATVIEFAIIAPIFLLLIAGALDFGHAWYMRQVITNASREGARYGITFKTNSSGVRFKPNSLNPSIQQYVLNNYLSNALPANANPTVTPGGAGYTSGTKGDAVEVTVTAVKVWFILSSFLPGVGDQKTIQAKTVMLCE
jgi:Flp pilus assembly protein TadG